KSFPVQNDDHLLTVCRYVERNALRAGLVARAEEWAWSSLWQRESGPPEASEWLTAWPVARGADWLRWVNRAQTPGELEALRRCVQRGQPFGSESWVRRTVARLGLAVAMRPRGRPRKQAAKKGS